MKAHYINILILAFAATVAIQYLKHMRPDHLKNPDVKRSAPTIAFLNLGDDAFTDLMVQDRAEIGALFSEIPASSQKLPECEVLFLYASIEENGALQGTKLSLRQLIAATHARIVVIATNNSIEGYVAALKSTGDAKANLVLTTNRKGEAFPRFFKRLFEIMLSGKSMPLAWVEIAPQGPISAEQKAATPDSAFAPELGQVSFSKR